MRISRLEAIAADGGRIALWGWGREGRAAYGALRRRESGIGNRESANAYANAPTPLTLFCSPEEAQHARALGDPALAIETEVTAQRLAAFDVVVKSPGISPYRPEAVAAAGQGTRFIGGTALWFAEHAGADGVVPGSICVTGTKGKSTTTALLAHLLRAGGHRTALAGNIGLPLLEFLSPEPPPEFWAIELSSYQTGDVAASGARPDVAVVLNVFPEHLDWHGGEDRYIADKLRLLTEARPRIAVLNANDPILSSLVGAGHARDWPLLLPPLAGGEEARLRATGSRADERPKAAPEGRIGWDGGGPDRRAKSIAGKARSCIDSDTQVRWFGREDGWHLRGDALHRGDVEVMDTATLPLPGRHNRGNLCAVLTAIEALGLDAIALAPHAATFAPLPHRLQTLGVRDGITYVNDSISTTPHASLAALEVFRGERVAILVGGHDRGLDWTAFAERMCEQPPAAVVTMGANGPRIHALLEPVARQGGFVLHHAGDLATAVAQARVALENAGVVLLSPGAPSFGPYRDYTQRGRDFARRAGFDPDVISAIPGLGIA